MSNLAGLILTLALAFGGIAGFAGAQPASSVDSRAIRHVLEDYETKGLTDADVLIAKNGVPVFHTSVGWANREWSIPNAADVAFRIGSITKQFVAVAVLQLAADHKLSLDDPIAKFIENPPPAWREITIRHLLTHTSGIPDFTALPETQAWAGRSPDDLIRLVRDQPLEAAPGAKFSYDNTGYIVLGRIVERASGQSLGEYLSTHVFAPLGMRRTGFVSDRVLPRRASGYIKEGTAWRATPWMSNVTESGAGALYATTDDLLRWDQALYDPRRLGLADLTAMFTDYGHGYGFAYVIGVQDGHVRWGHNGHIDGYSAVLSRYPVDKLTIIILSNDDGAPVELLSRDLATLLFKTLNEPQQTRR